MKSAPALRNSLWGSVAVAVLGGIAFIAVSDDTKLMLTLILILAGILGVFLLDQIQVLDRALLFALGFVCIINPRKNFLPEFSMAAKIYGLPSFYFISFLDLILIIIVLMYIARRFPDGWAGPRELFPALTRAAYWGSLALMGLSIFYAVDVDMALFQFSFELKCFLLMLVAANLMSTARIIHLTAIMAGLSCGIILEALLALLEYTRVINNEMFFLGVTVGGFQETLEGGLELNRAGGTYRHPNYLSIPAGALALLMWHLQASTPNPWLKKRRLYWLALGGALLCLWLSLSRGGWGAVLGGALFYWVISQRSFGWRWFKSLPWRYLSPLVLVMAVFLIFFGHEAYNKLFHSSPINFAYRMQMNLMTVEQIKRQPILGGGLGNHPLLTRDHPLYSATTRHLHAAPVVHNIYLLVASELGIIGVLFYFGIPFSLIVQTVRQCRARPDHSLSPLCLAVASALIVFLLSDLVGPGLRKIEVAYLFWLLNGILAGLLHAAGLPSQATQENLDAPNSGLPQFTDDPLPDITHQR